VAVIIHDKGKVLFVRRSKFRKSLPGVWSLPAETIVEKEPISDAAERCAWHELGLKIKMGDLVDELQKDNGERLFFVTASIVEGEPRINTDEIEKICWAAPRDFLNDFKDKDNDLGDGLLHLKERLINIIPKN